MFWGEMTLPMHPREPRELFYFFSYFYFNFTTKQSPGYMIYCMLIAHIHIHIHIHRCFGEKWHYRCTHGNPRELFYFFSYFYFYFNLAIFLCFTAKFHYESAFTFCHILSEFCDLIVYLFKNMIFEYRF